LSNPPAPARLAHPSTPKTKRKRRTPEPTLFDSSGTWEFFGALNVTSNWQKDFKFFLKKKLLLPKFPWERTTYFELGTKLGPPKVHRASRNERTNKQTGEMWTTSWASSSPKGIDQARKHSLPERRRSRIWATEFLNHWHTSQTCRLLFVVVCFRHKRKTKSVP